ncbi:MAG: Na+/H+ antiporter subunit E [Thiohalocapsa sp.]|jgi:multicomponent Na+:H+ antiporter subunit E|nr:Na+/H+ antiporter subunit E [Thiohalocapsa sp.]MCF7991124.1 Na+/H+ antiporter subunit E [Thiohalocapsa sp.]
MQHVGDRNNAPGDGANPQAGTDLRPTRTGVSGRTRVALIASEALGLLGRFALFAMLWWLLTDGRSDALVFGLCFAAAAALLSLVIRDPRDPPMQPDLLPTVLRLPLLVPFFFWESLLGGFDVALRAFKPRLPLAPAMIDYPLRLPAGPAPVMMASLVSLMPGTLAVVSGNRLRVHVLDKTSSYRDELERLEQHVACVFGITLGQSQADTGDAS